MTPEQLQAMCESKNRYPRKRDAQTAINSALRRRRNRPEHLRPYACPVCDGWHITHKADTGRKPKTTSKKCKPKPLLPSGRSSSSWATSVTADS